VPSFPKCTRQPVTYSIPLPLLTRRTKQHKDTRQKNNAARLMVSRDSVCHSTRTRSNVCTVVHLRTQKQHTKQAQNAKYHIAPQLAHLPISSVTTETPFTPISCVRIAANCSMLSRPSSSSSRPLRAATRAARKSELSMRSSAVSVSSTER
jgi:hypothetical protein